MSLDTRIAAAIEELERQTFVDATAGLARLRETHRRRRNTRAGTVAVALVLLAAGAFWRLGGPASKPEPAPVVPRVSNGVLVSIAPTGGKAVAVGGLIAHLPVGMPAWGGHLTWSSDGSQLVHDTSSGNLVALDVETGDVRILTTCSTPCLAGASSDTTLIAVAADDELTVRTPEGESVVPLPGLQPGVPVWSPDATRIAFAAPTGLYVVGADGSGLRRLVASLDVRLPVIAPSWSPDSRSLAYLAGTPVPGNPGGTDEVLNTTFSLVTVDVATGTTHPLAAAGDCFCLGRSPAAVAWSPDGRRVGFTLQTIGGGVKGVYAVPAEGGEAVRLSNEKVGGALAWQPVID